MLKKLLILIIISFLYIGILTPVSLYALDNGDVLYTVINPNAYGTSNSDQFGYDIDMNNDYLIVGAPYEDFSLGTSTGYAYIFDLSTNSLLYSLINPNFNNYTNSTDYFGWSVAIGDRYASVSAPYEDIVNSGSGIIYIYSLEDGSLFRSILNPNVYGTQDNELFGLEISMYGDLLLVGVKNEDSSAGSTVGVAYLYNVHSGALLYTIENPSMYGTVVGDAFGNAVSLNANYMVIGAYYEDDIGGSSSGAVYVFETSTGNLIYSIANPNHYGTSATDLFGQSVAINDDYIVVGAHYEDDVGGSNSGAVYVFETSTGNLINTIANPNAYNTSSDDYFGYAIDLYNNYLVVGAYYEDTSIASNSGAVYVYDLSTNTLLYTYLELNPSVPRVFRLGWSVAISNGYIGAGAPNSQDPIDLGAGSGLVKILQNELLIINHTISFNTNGGSVVSDIDVIEGTTLTPPTDPTKTDYLFERWYIDEDLTTAYDFDDPVVNDFTLYARWIEDTGGGGVVSGGLTNNTAFMIVAIILYLALLVIRFLSGVRVWNLFGIGILIYFIIQYSNIIPMVIVLIGFIIYQLYDTFIGGK